MTIMLSQGSSRDLSKKEFYEGTSTEYQERHKFLQHSKAWGSAHTGPGIRFVCEADALNFTVLFT